MNPRKASEDREKWLEGGGREAGGGEFDDDLGDKVPQFYIYKLPINRLSGPMLLVLVLVLVLTTATTTTTTSSTSTTGTTSTTNY